MVNPNSDFAKFLGARPLPPGSEALPILGQRPQPGVAPPAVEQARADALMTCPVCPKDAVSGLSALLPAPQLVGRTLMARCMRCMTFWEVDAQGKISLVRTFEQQIAEAMLSLQKKLGKT